MSNNAILFYDGTCSFCSGIVRFLLKHDKNKKLYYAPLFGKTFNDMKVRTIEDDTIIFHSKGQVLYKSDAVIYTLKVLGSGWIVLAKLIEVFPKIFRNFVYDLIGKLRYHFAGKIDNKTCPILPKEYQKRILP